MRRAPYLPAALLICLAWAAGPALADEASEKPLPGPFHKIHVIDFEGDIGGLLHAYVVRRLEAAQAAGADCIVLRIDSFGGTVLHSKKIGDALLAVPDEVRVVAWVPVKAISGAAFVALACDEIVMTPAASMGDSQPILQGADGKPEPIGEKIESPLRTWFRAYAERNGHPVLLAEAMVSQHTEVVRVRSRVDGSLHYLHAKDFKDAEPEQELVPGHRRKDLEQVGSTIVREGELLTLTGREALDLGFISRRFADGLPTSEEAVLSAYKAPGAQVTYWEMSFSEHASRWLLGLAGILSALVALAILFTLWQGPGLLTIAGGVALVLVILITATAEQLNGFPLFLVLLGALLLVAEVFVFPGFGVAGILGFATLGFGLLLLATGRDIGEVDTLDTPTLMTFALQFVATAIAGLATLLLLSRFLPRVGPARRMVLVAAGGSTFHPARDPLPWLPPAGARGVTRSMLRPAGTAEFDGKFVDVVSEGPVIEAGLSVTVLHVEGPQVTVGEPRQDQP